MPNWLKRLICQLTHSMSEQAYVSPTRMWFTCRQCGREKQSFDGAGYWLDAKRKPSWLLAQLEIELVPEYLRGGGQGSGAMDHVAVCQDIRRCDGGDGRA